MLCRTALTLYSEFCETNHCKIYVIFSYRFHTAFLLGFREVKNKSLFFVAAVHTKAQKSTLQQHSLSSNKTQHRSNATGSNLSEPPSHGLPHHSLNGVEAGRPGRDPAEAIRAMEAELDERRRIETMLKVG